MSNDAQNGSRVHPVEVIPVRDIELHFWQGSAKPPPSNDKIIYVRKDMPFVSRMDAVLKQVKPRRMIEIGILDGGSTIYWHDKYQLDCLIAFEIEPEVPHLLSYIQRHQLSTTVHPCLGVSQADGKALRMGVLNHTGGQLVDAVIDDASHQHAETRATVEALLPFVRPGGVYIIEDWGWGHNAKWPAELWINQPLLSPLVMELTLICGHASGIIEKIEIDPNFVAIWRGHTPLRQDGGFKLTDHYIARGFSVSL